MVVTVSSSVVSSLSSNDTILISEDDIEKVGDNNDEPSDTAVDLANITRSKRQLEHQIKTLPRLPRQIFRQQTSFSEGKNFVSFGGLSAIGRHSSSRVVLPPVTLPTVHGSSVMIQETKTKLLDSSSVRVDLQSDKFGHQHRIEDGKGNFQFFQIGKSERPKTQNFSQRNNQPHQSTFFPTPIPQQRNIATESPTMIASSSSFAPTISPLFSTSFTVTPSPLAMTASAISTSTNSEPIPTRPVETFLQENPRQPKAFSFGPKSSMFLSSNTTKLSNPSLAQQNLFSSTAIPVRGLPPMQRAQVGKPKHPASFPLFRNINRFGFSPLQFPKSAPATMTAPHAPTFFNPFPSPPQEKQFVSSNNNIFPPPLSHQRLPVPKQFMPQPFQPRPPVPKQFMPILMTPTMKTRHLAEPRVISTSRPLITPAPARTQEKERSKSPLLSFNQLQTLQSLSTTARPRLAITNTTVRTTTTRSTTAAIRTTTITTSRLPTVVTKATSSQQPNVFANFQIFSATMRPNPVQHHQSSAASPPAQFAVFPTQSSLSRIPSDNNQHSTKNNEQQQQVVSGHNNNAANANSLFTNGLDESMNLFAPINTRLRDEVASNFRQLDVGTPGPTRLATQPENRTPVNVRRIPSGAGAQTFQSTQSRNKLKQLHVFSPAPSPVDHDRSVFRNPVVSASLQTFLGGIGGNPSGSHPGPIKDIAQNLLSSFTKEQLEALRHQLTVSLFPQEEQKPLTNNHMTDSSLSQKVLTNAKSVKINPEEFRTFNKNFEPIIQTSPIATSTTTATSVTTTTKIPINIRLKSRERMIRNRHRARNPNSIRLTTTEKATFMTTVAVPDKPNLFDPFSKSDSDTTADNINSRLRISQNVVAHPQSVTKDKINAFANLLAVVNDTPETSTEAINIGSVSLGEGGFMSHNDMDVDTVTSHRVNQFEFFTPRPGEVGSRGLSTTMLPAFDEDYPNFALISTTPPPTRGPFFGPSVTPSSGSSIGTFSESSPKPTVLPIFKAPETTFQFAPTPMTTTVEEDYVTNEVTDNDLHVFSFQPTAPSTTSAKKVRFKPTTSRGRQFEFPSEVIENEIQDFTPKFIVDPGMKENFAIVKVKNHNTVALPRTSVSALRVPTTTALPQVEMTKRNFLTTLAARNRLLNKDNSSFRRRKVKRVKGQRRLKSSNRSTKTSDILESRSRHRINSKRLPFIRRTSINTTTTASKTPTTTKRFKIFNSGKIPEIGINEIDSDTKEFEETDPRVLELTNNILELKAKLEQLKLELDM